MKTLILVRHAKSSWDDTAISDIDRPLNERGKKDAPMMAERLKDKDIKIDAFVSSPAKRARKTCEKFLKEYKLDESDMIIEQKLYEAGEKDFFEVVEKLDNKNDHVALFSHNPGITWFVNLLSEVHVDNMPTSGVFAVKADTDNWADFKNAKKQFWFFDYPKSGD